MHVHFLSVTMIDEKFKISNRWEQQKSSFVKRGLKKLTCGLDIR